MCCDGRVGAGHTGDGSAHGPQRIALARVRQLSAHEVGHGVNKAVTAARQGYEKANQLGLIDKYGGQHAADIHRTARRGFSTYDQLSRAAQGADADFRAMRS